MASNRDWKERYLQSVEERDRLADEHARILGELRRALVRVSLAAEGQTPELDAQLDRLRTVARATDSAPVSALASQVDKVEDQLRALDSSRESAMRGVIAGLELLASQLSDARPSRGSVRELTRFARGLEQSLTSTDTLGETLRRFAELQHGALDDLAAAEPGSRASVWRRLFGDAEASSPDSPRSTITDEDQQSTGTRALDPAAVPENLADTEISSTAEQLEEPETNAEELSFSRLSLPVSRALDEVLDSIEAPSSDDDNAALYESTRTRLARAMRLLELVPSIDSVRVLVGDAFNRNLGEFEGFLRQLNETLVDTGTAVQVSRQLENSRIEASQSLNRAVQTNMDGLQVSMNSATEIEQLKFEISKRVTEVSSALRQFESQEQQLQSAYSAHLAALDERVADMEQRARVADRRLSEQRQLAFTDALTQIPNRLAYESRLKLEFDRWQRFRHPLSIAICDIDKFKNVNDVYGHLAGDRVLLATARALHEGLRKTDFAARFGGEEFVIIMAETGCEKGVQALELLRQTLAEHPISFHDQDIYITASFGISEFSVDDEMESAFARADKALYRAKHEGRNKVCRLKAGE